LARDGGAYALAVVDDSMWPRFRPGRILVVSPKGPVIAGDDVVVKLKGSAQAVSVPVLIKALALRTADAVELRQFNPDVTFSVPVGDIVSIEKVLGELV
jgi:phage repressor protein C with HTH and peptisase S24 domain